MAHTQQKQTYEELERENAFLLRQLVSLSLDSAKHENTCSCDCKCCSGS